MTIELSGGYSPQRNNIIAGLAMLPATCSDELLELVCSVYGYEVDFGRETVDMLQREGWLETLSGGKPGFLDPDFAAQFIDSLTERQIRSFYRKVSGHLSYRCEYLRSRMEDFLLLLKGKPKSSSFHYYRSSYINEDFLRGDFAVLDTDYPLLKLICALLKIPGNATALKRAELEDLFYLLTKSSSDLYFSDPKDLKTILTSLKTVFSTKDLIAVHHGLAGRFMGLDIDFSTQGAFCTLEGKPYETNRWIVITRMLLSGREKEAFQLLRDIPSVERGFRLTLMEKYLLFLTLYANRHLAAARKLIAQRLDNIHIQPFEKILFGVADGSVSKGDALEAFRTLPSTKGISYSWVLLGLLLYKAGLLDKDDLNEVEEYFQALPAVFRLEYLAATPSREKELKQLSNRLQMTPLLPAVSLREKWQIVIEKLSGSCEVKTERIAYFVSTSPTLSITPRLQKSSDGIKWTKGAIMNFGQFSRDRTCLTDVDTRLKSMARATRLADTDYLDNERFLPCLIGHPLVFDGKRGTPVTIVGKKLEISVSRGDDGSFSFSNNLDPSGREWWLTQSVKVLSNEDGIIEIASISDFERNLLLNLWGVDSFPPEAKDSLTLLLEKLSSSVPVMSELLDNSKNLPQTDGDCRITVRIKPLDENSFSVQVFVRPLATSKVTCRPGEGLASIASVSKGKSVLIKRNLEGETANWEKLRPYFEEEIGEYQSAPFQWVVDLAWLLRILEIVNENKEFALVEWPEGVKYEVKRPRIDFGEVSLSVHHIGHWFEVDGTVALDGKTRLKMFELLEKLRASKGNFIRLEGDEFVALSDNLRKQLQTLEKIAGSKRGKLRLSQYSLGVLDKMDKDGVQLDADKKYNDLLARISNASEKDFPVPADLKAELRDYQKEGFEWMSRLAEWGAGGILADDMGLGKTVQAIALMLSRKGEGASLVVSPTSVLMNWRDELERFAPSLGCVLYNTSDRENVLKNVGPGDVVLTTYGVLTQDIENFKGLEWNIVVLDEAHNIKNRATQCSKAVMELNDKTRMLLTGTPVQNHLSEIWNLFQFANPGLLGSFTDFSDRYIIPVEKNHDEGRQKLLKNQIAPFILRRTKNMVLDDLPPKTELTVKVALSKPELALYEQLREEAVLSLENGETSAIKAIGALVKLRQAANHPRLINEGLELESSKTKAFLAIAQDLISSSHKALVFSQFTSYLELVKPELDKLGIKYLYLEGSHSAAQRRKLVEEFKTGDAPLFLISLKAGGTGLNLTEADYVIHLDPWWNPAVEDQASDRAYRIGQKNHVTVYKLIAENTIEEKIVKLHLTKKSLADALLHGTEISTRFSKEEILALLRTE